MTQTVHPHYRSRRYSRHPQALSWLIIAMVVALAAAAMLALGNVSLSSGSL